MSFTRFLATVLTTGLFARAAFAVPMAQLTWRTETGASKYCVMGTYKSAPFNVFGTNVNFGSVGHILCVGTSAPGASTGHCEATGGPGIFKFDYSLSANGVSGGTAGFGGAMSNVSGSAIAGLSGALSYTLEGAMIPTVTSLPATTIPGCPITGGVQVTEGQASQNAVQQ